MKETELIWADKYIRGIEVLIEGIVGCHGYGWYGCSGNGFLEVGGRTNQSDVEP